MKTSTTLCGVWRKLGVIMKFRIQESPTAFWRLWDFLKTVQQSLEAYRSDTGDDTQERRHTCASKEEYRAAKGPECYYRTAQGHARGQRYRETSESKDEYMRYTRNFCELRKQIETLLNELAPPVNDEYSYTADKVELPEPVLRRPQSKVLHTTSEQNSYRNSTLTDGSQNSDTSSDYDRQSAISVDSTSLSSESEMPGSIGKFDKNSLYIVSPIYPINSLSHSQVDYSEKDPSDTEYYNETTSETQNPEVESDPYEVIPVCEEEIYELGPAEPTTLRQSVSTQENISYSMKKPSKNPNAGNNSLNDEDIYTDFDETYSEVQDPLVLKPLLNTEQIYDEISPAALRHSGKRKATSTGGYVPVGSPRNPIEAVRSQKHQIRGEPTSVTSSTLVTDLTDDEWMFIQLDRKNTKRILAGTSPGTFLVTTTATDSTLVLYAVNEFKRLACMTITRKNGVYCLNGGKKFTTLRELVRYYQQHRIKEDLQLKKPLCAGDVSKKVPHFMESILSVKYAIHGKKLASSFGCHLYDGKYKDTRVLFKVATTQQGMKGITNEALILPTLSHPNVMKMVGVTISGSWPTLILQHIRYQTLRDYLALTKHETKVTQAPRIIIDICAAMEYLEKNKVVHCALNAENCLVQKDGSAIVANFSLSHSVVDERYIIPHDSPPLPPECQPPEVVYARWYTAMSDIWAFGILVYEIYSNDGTQCPTFTGPDTCKLPPKPNSISEDVYTITTRCWRYNQYDRPTFTELKTKLQRVLHMNTTV